MTLFAQVQNGTVINIIVAEQDFIDSLPTEENIEWVKTDCQTYNNKHYDLDGKPDSGTPFRGNYAIIGGIYDKEKDIFCAAKPGADWTLDEDLIWQPPIPHPKVHDDTFDLEIFEWDEDLYQKDNTKGWVYTLVDPLIEI